MAASILLCRFSARLLCKSETAHSAAGNQPMRVICNKRHIIPLSILPRRKNDSQGTSTANSIIQ